MYNLKLFLDISVKYFVFGYNLCWFQVCLSVYKFIPIGAKGKSHTFWDIHATLCVNHWWVVRDVSYSLTNLHMFPYLNSRNSVNLNPARIEWQNVYKDRSILDMAFEVYGWQRTLSIGCYYLGVWLLELMLFARHKSLQ